MLTAIVSEQDLSHVLSEFLQGEISDVKRMTVPSAHRMYTAQWAQPDGPVSIVIRFFQSTRAEDDARTEANALRELSRAGYPVPELYFVSDGRASTGTPFIVMQCLPGRPLGMVALETPDTIPAWMDRASLLLLRLHGIKWRQAFDNFQPALEPLDFADRQIKWWSRQAQSLSLADATDGFSWLRSNLYRARQAKSAALVHRDFHPNNLLAHEDKVMGVVDWGELTIADPAVDVAWTRMVLTVDVSSDLGDKFVDAYCRRNPEVMQTLAFWEVFAACKRMTAIARGHRSTQEVMQDEPGEAHLVPTSTMQTLNQFMRARLTDED